MEDKSKSMRPDAFISDEVAAIAHEFHDTLHVRPRDEEAKALHEQAGFESDVGWWNEHIVG